MKIYVVYGHYDWESIYTFDRLWLFQKEEDAIKHLHECYIKYGDEKKESFSLREDVLR